MDSAAVIGRAAGENFPVASRFLPRAARGHLLAIYGFARLVDEIGDGPLPAGFAAAPALDLATPTQHPVTPARHPGAPGQRLAALEELERDLDRALRLRGEARHPLLRRLEPTLRACALPRAPFARLIEANRMDQQVDRYETWDRLEGYCRLSANPVGELVLRVFGAATPQRITRSDAICTALQLAEHCQDVAEDRGRGRVYLPAEDLRRCGATEADLSGEHASGPLRRTIALEVDRARMLLAQGAPLIGELDGLRERLAVAAFVAGGRAALDAIERADYDVLAGAPRAGAGRRLVALVATLAQRRRRAECRRRDERGRAHDSVPRTSGASGASNGHGGRVATGGRAVTGAGAAMGVGETMGAGASATLAIERAYGRCEAITRASALNFYYGIRLLSPERRRAMCAVYAFARRVDDIGDGPLARAEKLSRLDVEARALAALSVKSHALPAEGHALPADPVLVAMADAYARFAVPPDALAALIEGVRMDVRGETYERFDDLVLYCRHVAGAIGRACLAIFGLRAPAATDRAAAQSLADDLGVALQLTNILRDIREDAALGRVYLPAEDLRRFGLIAAGDEHTAAATVAGLIQRIDAEPQDADADGVWLEALVRFQAERARDWFERGMALVPLLDRRSAACAMAMAGIYSRLLGRIAAEPGCVLRERVTLSRREKAWVATRSLIAGAAGGPRLRDSDER